MQVWLMALVFIPARSGLGVKVTVAALVAAMTVLTLPAEIWKVKTDTPKNLLSEPCPCKLLLSQGLC